LTRERKPVQQRAQDETVPPKEAATAD
jgi:hypothetical protein